MEIGNQLAHRALAFVAAVNEQGYQPTEDEFQAYVTNPLPRELPRKTPPKVRRRAESEPRTFNAADAATAVALSALTQPRGALEQLLQYVAQPEVETTLDWLGRLGWLVRTKHEPARVKITKLGEAILRALDRQELGADAPLEVALHADDALAYAKVIGRIAQRGEALLVDPYFGLESLLYIVQQTGVTRVLVGQQVGKPALAALATAVSRMSIDREFAIRVGQKEDMHDRFIIPAKGPVDSVGTSLNALGKKLTVMTTIEPPVADDIRESFDRIWKRAERLEVSPLDEPDDGAEDPTDSK